MRSSGTILLLPALMLFGFAGSLRSQSNLDRPTIGLALGGGGARGLAHIGVLRWFEENRIPIDSIAGTSAGGLIGGLYSIGLTPSEIEELFTEQQWADFFSSQTNYPDRWFRRKEDLRDLPTSFRLNWNAGLTFTEGLVPPHPIGLVLDSLAVGYSDLDTFDDLPIPFRSIAVDLLTGQRKVFDEGSLPEAINATMAVPGIMSPAQVGDQLFVDGGILDNLPTSTLKDMNADYIVAVDVASELEGRDSLASFLDVLNQSITIIMSQNVASSRELAQIVIDPDLGSVASSDFEDAGQIAQLGYDRASQLSDRLRELSVSETEWRRHIENREARRRRLVASPTTVGTEPPDHRDSFSIISEVETVLQQGFEGDVLEQRLNGIQGSGRYARIGYERQGPSGEILLVKVRDPLYESPSIHLGIDANNTEADDVRFSLVGRLTVFDVGTRGSEIRFDGRIGTRLSFSGEYYRPLSHGYFVAPRVFSDRVVTSLFRSGERVAEYKTTRWGVGVDIGYGFGSGRSEARAGYEISIADAEVRLGLPLLPSMDGPVSRARAQWIYDGLDSATIPHKGLGIRFNADWFFRSPGSDTGFPKLEVVVSEFVPVNQAGTVFLRGAGGTAVSKTAPPIQHFTLGGPFRLGAFGTDEFRGSRYLFASAGYLHRVLDLPIGLGRGVYGALWHEVGSTFERGERRDYLNSASAGMLVDTIVGPFFLGTSWGEGGRRKVYFSLGRIF